MSEKMIAAARAFAKGKKFTFPLMQVKDLKNFIDLAKEERQKAIIHS
ncbi:conserved hypothetical protein [Xenorhabdus bovienii str. puntauvense]|uniref:Uncharacterized protein n=1 Tax=Xenorhabdus bovienii str. puntauvense TaxID=1398201 RepID=A0A077NL20_XENBV|nr:hypothetical protein [Xenorhabdus bovienii]CDG98600.1 conserved hypothetical protein [Xenorhabdus bovienii str. puntauvense]